MAPRRAAFAAGALATWCLLLVTAGAAPTKDGFLVPLASNDAWDYYEFNMTAKVNTTSVNPFNSSRGAKDTTAPGTLFTHTVELTNPKGELVGILQAVRPIVGDNFNMPGSKGTRVLVSVTTMMAEFGTPEAGYFDDAIAITTVNKPFANPKLGPAYVDYDAAITGGTGRFLGAIGTVEHKPVLLQKSLAAVVRSTMVFQVWVPRNLPTPKGPVSGRRRAL